MRLGEMTWTQVREAIEAGVTAVLPLGSVEEHGPHNVVGDYLACDKITAAATDQTGDVMAPVMPFGYSEYFRNYPGTITMRAPTLAAVVTDAVECLLRHRFRRIAIFNGHAGNAGVLNLVTRRFRRKREIVIPTLNVLGLTQTPEVVERVYGRKIGLGHGGEPMGSLMMHVVPGRVQMQRAGEWARREVFGCPTEGLDTIRVSGIRVSVPLDMEDVTPPTGSLSDPTPATPERGRQLFEHAVEGCVTFLRWFRNVDPYLGPVPPSNAP
ncbi:MAG TPA: creatininase family protein [bacterium]|nr:creatininase family protein [bacterium]